MLHILANYASQKGLVTEPGFKPKQVRWAIVFDGRGKFIEAVDLGDAESKTKKGRTFRKCPDLTQPEMISGGVTRSQFLVDTTETVVLFSQDRNDEDAVQREKTLKKHEYFVNMLREAGQLSPEVIKIADALQDTATLREIQKRLKQLKARPTDKVTIRLDSRWLVEEDWWHEWWRSYRRSLESASPPKSRIMRCFLTGRLEQPARTHPKVTGLASVGGQPSGDVLIGFDKEAFSSYGLEQSENAAVSQEAASCYRAALEDLIRESAYTLALSVKVVHWYQKRVTPDEDPLAFLIESPGTAELIAQHKCRELFQSIQSGKRPDLEGNRYYALTMSGAGGRIMVRDWMEGGFPDLVANIMSWFEDFAITKSDGQTTAKDPKFLSVLSATVREPKDLERNGTFVSKMWRAALRGERIPRPAVAQAIHRLRLDLLEDREFNHARMGLLRAYLLRKYRTEGGDVMVNELKPFLNELHPHPAYHAGRLLAVMSALQKRALGTVGAGIIQRYYAAASTTPALVLGRLARISQFHLSKLENENIAAWYENLLAGIWARIENELPRILGLDEQSLFALGYYQQIAHMRAPRNKIAQTNENEEGENS